MTESTKTKFDWLVYSVEEEMHLSICNKLTSPNQFSFQGLQKNWPDKGLWAEEVEREAYDRRNKMNNPDSVSIQT